MDDDHTDFDAVPHEFDEYPVIKSSLNAPANEALDKEADDASIQRALEDGEGKEYFEDVEVEAVDAEHCAICLDVHHNKTLLDICFRTLK
jgi:hypothetical protein